MTAVARWSCLAGIALSYAPFLACLLVLVALFAWGGAFGTALTLLVAALIGYAIFFVISVTGQLQHRGVRVTATRQPELMAVVDNVMRQAGIKRLDGVWLAPEPGAWALRGRRDWLGRRHVGVAVGLLMAAHLSAEELTAILAHEAGHLRPCWERRIAPVSFFEAYETIWARAPQRIEAAVEAWMRTPEKPDDTHPGLAERCGGRSFPLAPALLGDIPLPGLAEFDRRFAVSLRWQEVRVPMKTMTWAEIKAEFARQDAGPQRSGASSPVGGSPA